MISFRVALSSLVLLLAVTQMLTRDGGTQRIGPSSLAFLVRSLQPVAFAGVNDDNGDEDNNSDNDNSDYGDNDGDNGRDRDNEEDSDTASASSGPPPPPANEASGVTSGGESVIALPNGRVTVRVFSTMPQGIRLTIRLADPGSVPPTPSQMVGSLLFQVQAQDAAGNALASLPADVNLSVRYSNQEAGGLNEQSFQLSRLDQADDQWKPAPAGANDPANNIVAATITETGFYAAHAS